VPPRRATWPNGEWGYSTRRLVQEPVRPEAVFPDRALYLPTFSHFLIVNKTSLSLSLPPGGDSICCKGSSTRVSFHTNEEPSSRISLFPYVEFLCLYAERSTRIPVPKEIERSTNLGFPALSLSLFPFLSPCSRTQGQAESEGMVLVAYAGPESPAAALRNIGICHISVYVDIHR
jgi:hypothetical protein